MLRPPVHPRRGVAAPALAAALARYRPPGALSDKPARPPRPRPQAQRRRSAARGQQASRLCGSETCQRCHEDIFKAFQKNPHQSGGNRQEIRAHPTQACEACHGPGSKHAESMNAADIRNPAKLQAGGGGPRLPHLPSEPAHPRGPHQQQPRQEPGELRELPLHPQERSRWPGGAQAGRHQPPVRRMPHGRVGQLPAALSSTGCRKAPCRAWIATIRTAACCRAHHADGGRQRAGLLQVPRR